MVFTSLSPMKKAIPFEHYTHPEGQALSLSETIP
jgi:hypothetical protein